LNKWDKILIASVLLLSVLALAAFEVFAFGKSGERVEIYVDGQLEASYNFRNMQQPVVHEVQSQYGYNKVIIDSSGAYVEDSDCKDRTEIKQGRIYKANSTLVCLPNRLVVRIVGGYGDADVVSY